MRTTICKCAKRFDMNAVSITCLLSSDNINHQLTSGTNSNVLKTSCIFASRGAHEHFLA